MRLHMNLTEFTVSFSNGGLTSYLASLIKGFPLTHSDGYGKAVEGSRKTTNNTMSKQHRNLSLEGVA